MPDVMNKALPFKVLINLNYAVLLVFSLAACESTKDSSVKMVKSDTDSVVVDQTNGFANFTIAVIPDTQNYLDYTRQRDQGFAVDSVELFHQQMQFIANNAIGNGGNIVFATSLGDVWQHQSKSMDEEHLARGFRAYANPILKNAVLPKPQSLSFEIPQAIEGFKLLADAELPFAVAPGNHDYDAQWAVEGFPPNLDKPAAERVMEDLDLGLLHVGGLENFRSALGSETAFFKEKEWYISHFRGGANSAQKFAAGGYWFLHLALEMQPDDEVLDWAASVVQQNFGLPTIVTTHDYLDPQGRRQGVPIIDLTIAEPEYHNNGDQLWEKFFSQHDQIFLVLSGHHYGQAHRVDKNIFGQKVIQILADYQERGQVGLAAGQPLSQFNGQPKGIGDGWLRLLQFEIAEESAQIKIKTYSTYYQQYSDELEEYARWYKPYEAPNMSDDEFNRLDRFDLTLNSFHERFARARVKQ